MSDEDSTHVRRVRRRTSLVYNAHVQRPGDAAACRAARPAADPAGIARDVPGRSTGREDA